MMVAREPGAVGFCGYFKPVPSTDRMSQTNSTTYGPGDLVRLALDGRLRIPRFQRGFVWDEGNISDLFDSIWKGYPVGTLLLWQQQQPAAAMQFGSIGVDASSTDDALVVVDGQQRVTTLIAALAPGPSEPRDPRFEVWFDLRTGRFSHAGRRAVPDFWLPVRVALESRTLLGWMRDHADALELDEIDRADAMAGAIRDYKIPAYVIEQDDEDMLRDVFDRVNSAGRPINRAQIFHALFGGNTDSGTSAAVVAELHHEQFGDLDDQRVVQSLLAVRGGNVGRDLHGEFASNEDPVEWFDLTTHALSRAIRFLKRLGVPHLELVPSALPIPVLAAFFHVHPQPDPQNERLLARWVWRGRAHGYGRAGQTPALRRAVQAINPVKLMSAEAPTEFEAVKGLLETVPDAVPPTKLTAFNASSAAGRLAMLALADLAPRRPGGDLLDLPEVFAQSGSTVIAILAGSRGSDLGARGLWHPQDPRPSGDEDPDVLATHAIDRDAALALKSRDIDAFVARRGDVVKSLVDGFLRRKLEPGLKAIPPLQEFWVPDPS
jgi:Protein of unknown function DUF262